MTQREDLILKYFAKSINYLHLVYNMMNDHYEDLVQSPEDKSSCLSSDLKEGTEIQQNLSWELYNEIDKLTSTIIDYSEIINDKTRRLLNVRPSSKK